MNSNNRQERARQFGQVFTPHKTVKYMLDRLPKELFECPTKTFLDPAAGDGNFLTQVVKRKIKNGSTTFQALQTTFGVDIMPDNVMLCRTRLLLAALGMHYSDSTSSSTERQIGTDRERLVMYVLYRMSGASHTSLMNHVFTHENNDLKVFVNPEVNLLQREQYPSFNDFKEFAMVRLNKTYNTARTEYYVIRNPKAHPKDNNLNLLNQLHLVRILFHNIVCANSLTEWDFENWCFKKTPQTVANQLLEF